MKKIAVLAGDGIGPEVVEQGCRLLRALGTIELVPALIGGAAIDRTGTPLPPETLALCRESDAVLLGAVGGPKWKDAEQGLLGIRRELGLFANLRPVAALPELAASSPLKPERLDGVSLLIVRELTGGIYFGEKRRDGDTAVDVCSYSVAEIERIARVAFGWAADRRRMVTSVDKANVMETSRLWREVVTRIAAREFPRIALEHQLVDSMAMALIQRPADFDVILTENLFGDILSDEAAVLAGSIGMLPSASFGERHALYEPVHGSAPDLAGRGVANPYGTILSVALMLRESLELRGAADAIDRGVKRAIADGVFTPDLGGTATTSDVGDAVLRELG